MLKPRKKVTRKELKRDPLMETLYNLRRWWLKHRTRVSRLGGLALIVVILSVLVIRWRASQDQKAAAAVGVAFVEFGKGNYNTVIAQLNPYVDEYSGLRSFGNGLFLLARSELFAKDTLNAEEHYRLYLKDYGKDPLLKAGAQAGLAVIAEGRGQYIEAADYFSKASRSAPTSTLKRRYAVFAGRNYILSGQPQQALNLLTPLMEDDLDFPTRSQVQELIASATSISGEQ